MIEVVTAPSHLAGAIVEHVKLADGGKMLVTDIPHPSFPGDKIAVAEDYVTTEHMLPTQAASYRLAVMLREGAKDEDIRTFARTKAAELDVSVQDLFMRAAVVLMHKLNAKEGE